MPLTPEQLIAVQTWNESVQQLIKYKAEESKQRDALVAVLFSSKDEGVESIEVYNGWKLKATKKLDYKLSSNNEQVTAIIAMLPVELAAKLFKWKAELSISTYKECEKPTQDLLNGCLTIKPAKASLELIPPKREV